MKKLFFALTALCGLTLTSCEEGIEIAIDINETFSQQLIIPFGVDTGFVHHDTLDFSIVSELNEHRGNLKSVEINEVRYAYTLTECNDAKQDVELRIDFGYINSANEPDQFSLSNQGKHPLETLEAGSPFSLSPSELAGFQDLINAGFLEGTPMGYSLNSEATNTSTHLCTIELQITFSGKAVGKAE